ncbi:GNAT family N-acetyltransferase [Homoserinimonas sp. A520]
MRSPTDTEYRILPAEIGADRFAVALGAGWDWPVAGCSSLAEYVELAIAAPGRRFFWLLGDDQPLGFFRFAHNDALRRFETGTYLAPEARGTGANRVIKHSSIAAFQAMGLPLSALVRDEKLRSLAAMRRISGGPGQFQTVAPNTLRWVFDLHSSTVDPESVSQQVHSQVLEHAGEFNTTACHATRLVPLAFDPYPQQGRCSGLLSRGY